MVRAWMSLTMTSNGLREWGSMEECDAFWFLRRFFLFDEKIHYKAKTIQRPIFVKKYFLQIHMDSPQNSLFPPNSCNWESIRLSPNNQNLLLLTFAQVDPFGVPGV